jgi:predicted GNAT family acetyltransferase
VIGVGATGFEPTEKEAPNTEKKAAPTTPAKPRVHETDVVPPSSGTSAGDLARQTTEPTDAEIERAIVAAMLDGRGSVAEMLTEKLKAQRAARAVSSASNVVALLSKRNCAR